MKKIVFIAWVIFINEIALVMKSEADFSLYWRSNNYFVSEYRYFNSLDLNKEARVDRVGNTRSFATMKLHMKPSLSITDRLSFHMGFDVFVNPFSTHAQEGGALFGEQAPDTINYGPKIDSNLPRALFGSETGYGRSALTNTNNILVKEGFLEYVGDWGIFRLGRIPRHWGIGIRYHSGDKPSDKFSDRTDSLFYELGLGSFKVAAIYSKISENLLDTNRDDVSLMEGYMHWNDPEKDFDIGGLYSFLKNTSHFIAHHTLDAYVTKKFSKFSVGVEGAITSGKAGLKADNAAKQLGGAAEIGYDWTPNLKTIFKTGYASGADINDNKTLSLFVFNRNYDIGLLMFNQGVGAIADQTGVSASSKPDANVISNALFGNIEAQYRWNDRIGAGVSYAIAQAPKVLVSDGGKFYGHEGDVQIWYQFLENLKFQGGGGLFLPGDIYKGGRLSRITDPAVAGYATVTLSF